jgi:hypothetical protein
MPKTMQAVVKAQAAPGIELREVPIPQISPNMVLVQVQSASVCGTDLHIYNWDPWAQGRIHTPLIPESNICKQARRSRWSSGPSSAVVSSAASRVYLVRSSCLLMRPPIEAL